MSTYVSVCYFFLTAKQNLIKRLIFTCWYVRVCVFDKCRLNVMSAKIRREDVSVTGEWRSNLMKMRAKVKEVINATNSVRSDVFLLVDPCVSSYVIFPFPHYAQRMQHAGVSLSQSFHKILPSFPIGYSPSTPLSNVI